ncbi:plasmid mobilization relaxosome protein MobC [Ruminococcus sp. AM29-12LB]|nr:plasmid mobilization relaxosome protein MobC [Ruminococcus sp. AM29-12LB]
MIPSDAKMTSERHQKDIRLVKRKKDMKNRIITFRVTDEEYALLTERTKKTGITGENLSEYIRQQVFGEEYPYQKEKLLRDMNYQIRKIGVNLNQIAARYNSSLYLEQDRRLVMQYMEELKMLLEKTQDMIWPSQS